MHPCVCSIKITHGSRTNMNAVINARGKKIQSKEHRLDESRKRGSECI